MADAYDVSSAETEISNAIEYVKSVSKSKASVKNIHKYMIKYKSDVNEELLKGLIEQIEEKEVIKIVVMLQNLTTIEQSKIRVDNAQ